MTTDTHVPGRELQPVDTPLAFFNRAYDAFAQAEHTAGQVARTYRVGQHTLRLNFAGPALVPAVTPAFEHLAAHGEEVADLTVCIWDSASTGVAMPARPWEWNQTIGRGDVAGYNDERIHTAFASDLGLLMMLDTQRNLALYWLPAPHQLQPYERAAPFRAICHWWFRTHGLQMVHSGAVGTDSAGVLLAGRSGAGKSTTAIACATQGMRYVADDFCLVEAGATPRVMSLYNSAKLGPASLARFPHLTPPDWTPTEPDEKALLFLHQHAWARVAASLPLRAILLPTVTGGTSTTYTPVSPIAILTELAPSSTMYLPGAGQAEFRTMAAFVSALPCYRLNLGGPIAHIPAVITEVLCSLA